MTTQRALDELRAKVRSDSRAADKPADYSLYLNRGPNDVIVGLNGSSMRSVLRGDSWITPDGKWAFYPKRKP